jgi:hypothetical protein
MRKAASILAAIAALAALHAPACAEGTDNHLLRAVPAPGTVVIDGRLDDWDRSGRIIACPDPVRLSGTYSATVMMMHDTEALYVAVEWRDPTPMVNDYDPTLDIDRRKCFHADSLQLHVRTDRERKLIGWWHARSRRAAAIALDGWFPWEDKPIVYHDALVEDGVQEAFTVGADGDGYVQELRIPWRAIAGRAYHAGERFDCMLDVVWGPDSGKGWPVAHLMDLVAPGAVHTGWFWEVPRIYGQVELSPQGHLPEPAAATITATAAPETGILVRTTLPDPQAPWFSLAIESADGARVRTLRGSCRTAEQRVPGSADAVAVRWDGRDDRGLPAAPGRYRVVGLVRGELSATYEQCFYNPGTPPWPTADGTGAWGADHTPPTCIAAAGDGVVIGWGGVEGGTGLIAIGADGRKRWGQHQGARLVAVDGDAVYLVLDDFWSGRHGVARVSVRDGSYLPWTIAGHQEMPIDPVVVMGGAHPGLVVGLAVRGDRLVLAFASGVLAEFSAATMRLVRRVDMPGIGALAFAADGSLYALAQGRPCRIELEAGTRASIPAEGLGRGVALALTAAGELVIADQGIDQQLKVFTPAGRLLRSAGTRGGRARHGLFDAQTMRDVSGVAADAQGRLWAVECGDLPRRVSVWGGDGRLVRDYVGNAAYSASGTYLHDQDPTLSYAGAVEFRRDGAARSWSVRSILWDPDWNAGERFPVHGGLAPPQRFTSAASGRPHEYLFTRSDWGEAGFTVYLEHDGRWRPVAAIGLVGHVAGRIADGKVAELPSGSFAGLDPWDGLFWNDGNGDGAVQRDECVIVPSEHPARELGKSGRAPLALSHGWGSRIGDDLAIYADGAVVYRPTGFAADGAPLYGPAGMRALGIEERGDFVPLDGERRLVVLSSTGYGAESYIRGLEQGTWREQWRYPAHDHGVHGSHHAPMPSPGSIIGALRVIGAARLDQGGSVIAIRGNLGQDFLITSDGLYVGELFRDSRLPGPSLPADEAAFAGQRVDDRSEGGEPFNGWFGRQSDGVVRISTGIPGQAALIAQVHGLDTIRRFRGDALTVTAEDLQRATAPAALPATTAGGVRKRTVIHRRMAPPTIDGDLADWIGDGAEIARPGSPERARVQLAYDERCLYAAFAVSDPSPWRNRGGDAGRLFKTGDAVDLQLAVTADAGDAVGPHLRRLLIAPQDGKAVCVLMRPVDPAAPSQLARTYLSPVGARRFDRVEVLAAATVAVQAVGDGYRVELAVPLAALGFAPKPGLSVRGDLGLIVSDADGTAGVARLYWSNRDTNLVNDEPSEAWLTPAAWGDLVCE